jgi:hypothetical protein
VEASICTAMPQVGLRQRALAANPRWPRHRKCHIANSPMSRDHNSTYEIAISPPAPSRLDCFLCLSKVGGVNPPGVACRRRVFSSPSPSSACHQTIALRPSGHPSVPVARWQLGSAIHFSGGDRSGLITWRLGRRWLEPVKNPSQPAVKLHLWQLGVTVGGYDVPRCC